MIDSEGFRANVGIILSNADKRLFWGKRIGQQSWQFPQGGIQNGETPEQAMYRELDEEVGLQPQHVKILGETQGWLRYRLPPRLLQHHRHSSRVCIGQKQIWFLLSLEGQESDIMLDRHLQPEFDGWRWVDYWYPLDAVVYFKRGVYLNALREFAPLLFGDESLPAPSSKRTHRGSRTLRRSPLYTGRR